MSQEHEANDMMRRYVILEWGERYNYVELEST